MLGRMSPDKRYIYKETAFTELRSSLPALQHLLGLGFLFFCTDFSWFIYTVLKDLLRTNPFFFKFTFYFSLNIRWFERKKLQN